MILASGLGSTISQLQMFQTFSSKFPPSSSKTLSRCFCPFCGFLSFLLQRQQKHEEQKLMLRNNDDGDDDDDDNELFKSSCVWGREREKGEKTQNKQKLKNSFFLVKSNKKTWNFVASRSSRTRLDSTTARITDLKERDTSYLIWSKIKDWFLNNIVVTTH